MPPPADGLPAASVVVRRRQIALAGHLGDHQAARHGLRDADAAVRATALGALDRLSALTLEDVDAAGRDPHPGCAPGPRSWPLAFGPPPRPWRPGPSRDPDPVVVEAGCFALGEIGAAAAATVAGSRPTWGATTPTRSAGRPPWPPSAPSATRRGLPAILAATSDKPAVRRRAVLALAPFSGPEVEAALDRARSDRDWQVRQAAEDLTGR